MCKMSKNRNFWHLEGNTMLLTPVNHLCFRAHMFFVRDGISFRRGL